MFLNSCESSLSSITLNNNSLIFNKTELIINHIELGLKLAWKLLNSWQARLQPDDVKSIVGIALCEAANNFDGRPGVQFQTFLFYHLRGRLLREITESVRSKAILNRIYGMENIDLENSDFSNLELISDNIVNQQIKTAEDLLITNEENNILNESLQVLDSLEKEIICRHYIEQEALVDLAKELGYCRCHLSRVKRRALLKLKKTISGNLDVDLRTSNKAIPKLESYTGGRGRSKKKIVEKIKIQKNKHKIAA